jgi:hypothetical protein
MSRLSFYDSGVEIEFQNATFSQNASQWVTNFDFTLKGENTADFVGRRLVYKLGGKTYHVVIDDYSGGKSAPGKAKAITGRALTALLDEPHADIITRQTWRNVMFSAIVDELCTAAGVGVQFQINDSFVRQYTAEEKTPIEIIRELANDLKVSLQTSLDGQFLIVCYKFKYPPAVLSSASVDKALTRLFPYTYQLDNINDYDALLVKSELNQTANASVDQKAIADYIRVRVFLDEWSNTPPTLNHYDDDTVTVEYSGVKTIEKTLDDVAIDEGIGKVEPGCELVDFYFYCKDLGVATLLPNGTVNTSIAETGLMRLVVSKKCHEFKLRSTCCDKVRVDVQMPESELSKVHEIRIKEGNKFADPVIVKYFDDATTLIAAGNQALIALQDFLIYNIPCDHWDDLPLPCQIVSFEGINGYCDGFSVSDGKDKVKATVTVKIPVVD